MEGDKKGGAGSPHCLNEELNIFDKKIQKYNVISSPKSHTREERKAIYILFFCGNLEQEKKKKQKKAQTKTRKKNTI